MLFLDFRRFFARILPNKPPRLRIRSTSNYATRYAASAG